MKSIQTDLAGDKLVPAICKLTKTAGGAYLRIPLTTQNTHFTRYIASDGVISFVPIGDTHV